MSVAAVNQVEFGTAIAAVNNSSHLRVYFQAIYAGVRESTYEGGWGGGLSALSTITAKFPTPLAATSKGLTNVYQKLSSWSAQPLMSI
jgi:chorismate synthase